MDLFNTKFRFPGCIALFKQTVSKVIITGCSPQNQLEVAEYIRLNIAYYVRPNYSVKMKCLYVCSVS